MLGAMTELQQILDLDPRRRASFGRIGRPEHRRYLVMEEPDGTLILTPAVVVSELEARFMSNPTLVARVDKTRANLDTLVRRGDRLAG